MPRKYLVTGAAGQLGSLVIQEMLANGTSPADIIATTRSAEKLAGLAALGVDARLADFERGEDLASAFAGADRIVIISTDNIFEPGRRLTQHLAAVAAAQAAGIRHIVYTSMPNPEPGSSVTFAPDHMQTELAIKASGIPHTILRNSWYQENLLQSLPAALASGHWYTSAGEGRLAHVARADCARAVAAALTAETSESSTRTLTGGQLMTTAEIAALASEVLGRPIAVVHLSDDDLAAGIKASGLPEPLVPILVGFDANTRNGGVDVLTDDINRLTGREPRTLRQFFLDNSAAFSA